MAELHGPILLRKIAAVHAALDEAGLPHAIGGGIALAFHTARPRFTNDIDVNVAAPATDPERVLDALPASVVVHPSAADELRRTEQVRVFWPEAGQEVELGTPIDLFLPAHPSYHALVTARAESVVLGGTEMAVISATDLVIFKVLFDRSQDWVDIEAMLDFGKVDLAEVERWLHVIIGADDRRLARLHELVDQG